jgi:CheY-like chemotaxis protein
MDCQMPVLDGFAATVRIRQVVGRARVRVIGVSASTEELTRRRCLESGMDGYLSKPIDLARLRAVLEGLPRG